MPHRASSPVNCPVCGAAVPVGAKSCRECGADERAGWNEEGTRYDGLDLPDEAFDDDENLRDGDLKARHRPKSVSVLWWIVGMVLLVIMAKLALGL